MHRLQGIGYFLRRSLRGIFEELLELIFRIGFVAFFHKVVLVNITLGGFWRFLATDCLFLRPHHAMLAVLVRKFFERGMAPERIGL